MDSFKPPTKCHLIKSFIKSDLDKFIFLCKKTISRKPYRLYDPSELFIPDSELIKRALQYASELYPESVLNHSIRSYQYGCILGFEDGVNFDSEVFFIGSLFHDLGLIHTCENTTFEKVGAELGVDKFKEFKSDSSKREEDLIYEMIALHDAVGIADKKDNETKLLHMGAGIDIAGIWDYRLHKEQKSIIFKGYPLLDMKAIFKELLTLRMNENPNMYLSTLIKLGFFSKIDKANREWKGGYL